MDYQGIIIEESLENLEILQELEIVHTEIEKVTASNETPWLDKWTMHTILIEENKIDEYAEKLSKLIDIQYCENWYCDFKNEQFHYVIFSNKVFKLNRSNEQDYVKMIQYAISIGLPEHQLPKFSENKKR